MGLGGLQDHPASANLLPMGLFTLEVTSIWTR
jgi:hypothetical protein